MFVSSVSFVYAAPYGGGYGASIQAVAPIQAYHQEIAAPVLDVVTPSSYAPVVDTTAAYAQQQPQPVMDIVTPSYGTVDTTTVFVPPVLDTVTQGYGAVEAPVAPVLDVVTQGYGAVETTTIPPVMDIVTPSYGTVVDTTTAAYTGDVTGNTLFQQQHQSNINIARGFGGASPIMTETEMEAPVERSMFNTNQAAPIHRPVTNGFQRIV